MDESGGQSSDANFVELLASDLFFASAWRSVKEFVLGRRQPKPRANAQPRDWARSSRHPTTRLDSG
jgi:hypothetical protein